MEFVIPVGSEVQIPNISRTVSDASVHLPPVTGVLKFVGQVKGKTGTFAGVDLLGDNYQGKNNGSVDGISYFKTRKENSGLFVPYSKLVSANINTMRTAGSGHVTTVNSNSPRMSSIRSPHNQARQPSSKIFTASPTGVSHEMVNIMKEKEDLETKLQKYEYELRQRTIDLIDITKNFNELEQEIEAGASKLARQKRNYDRQRDELRDAIRVLEHQAEQNAQLYQEEILRLTNNRQADDTKDKIILQLKSDMIESQQELQQNEQQIKASAKANEELSLQLEKVRTDKTKLEKVIEELHIEIKQMKSRYEEHLKQVKEEEEASKAEMKDAKQQALDSQKQAETLQKENETLRSQLSPSVANVPSRESPAAAEHMEDSNNTEELRAELEMMVLDDSIKNDEIENLKEEAKTLKAKLLEKENSHKMELKAIDVQYQTEIKAKDSMIGTLSKKILDLERQVMLRTSSPAASPLAENIDEGGKFLKNIVNVLPPTPSSPSSGKPPSIVSREFGTTAKRSLPRLREVASNITINETSISQLVDGELMVYIPEKKTDPSAGREKWCGLCERQGHESVDCGLF